MSFSLNDNSLWLLDRQTNQVRVLTFKYNYDYDYTEEVIERRFILPVEIKIKEDSSGNEALRECLVQNLEQKLLEHKSEESQNKDRTFIREQVSQISKVDHSQIAVIRDTDVCINTEKHGVMYFSMDKIDE